MLFSVLNKLTVVHARYKQAIIHILQQMYINIFYIPDDELGVNVSTLHSLYINIEFVLDQHVTAGVIAGRCSSRDTQLITGDVFWWTFLKWWQLAGYFICLGIRACGEESGGWTAGGPSTGRFISSSGRFTASMKCSSSWSAGLVMLCCHDNKNIKFGQLWLYWSKACFRLCCLSLTQIRQKPELPV